MSQVSLDQKERERQSRSRCEDEQPPPLTSRMNGTLVQPMGGGSSLYSSSGLVITPEMCFFCFDVLHCHLNQSATLRPPTFSNESL